MFVSLPRIFIPLGNENTFRSGIMKRVMKTWSKHIRKWEKKSIAHYDHYPDFSQESPSRCSRQNSLNPDRIRFFAKGFQRNSNLFPRSQQCNYETSI